MADPFIFEFGADVTKFNASIGEVAQKLKELKEAAKNAKGGEIPILNKQIADLTQSLKNLKALGNTPVDPLNKVTDSAKGARIALTNVSQIAQDLPFGFIGIQNNIPGLIQSFGKLSTESGGAVAALKAMGSALIGPAGIFLAFSLATAAVTAIIQKYGSLGNALTVLFSKNKLLATSQLEYNKALEEGNGTIGGEIGQITVLTQRLNNLQLSNRERLAAYFELGKIAPEIIANIEKENALTANSISLINIAAKARIAFIKLKVQENAITSVLDKTQLEVIKKESELGFAKRKTLGFEQELLKVQKDPISRTRALREAQLTNKIEAQNIVVTKAREELFKTYDVQNSYYKLLDPVIAKISEYDLATEKVGKSTKEAKKEFEQFNYLTSENAQSYDTLISQGIKYGQTIADVNNKYKERNDALNELKKLDSERFASYSLEKTSLVTITDSLDTYIRTLENAKLAGIARGKASDLQAEADKNSAQALTERIKAEEKFFDALVASSMQSEKNNATDIIAKVNIDNALQPLKDIIEGTKRAAALLQEVFFAPLNQAFETLFTKGTFAIKDFTKALLNSIGQIAAKLAATAIVNGLISLFAAPFGGALSGAGSLGFLGNLIGGIGGRTGSANFGGIQGGGFGMSGSVNMVLRGTDLVGSINRTNSQISRVG